jgi:hypothetical protein
VAGVVALLLNAFPGITTESQAAALTNTSVDLGASGPDNDFGYGMLDALAAYNWLAAGNRVTPTPAPTATATAIPTATPTPSPTPFIDVIFSDGFESGDLNQWSSAVTDGGRLSVSPQAALVGTQGMQALVNSTQPIYVLDTSPSAEATYHARFYFTPNSISVPKNKPHDVFIGRNSTGKAIFKLQLRPPEITSCVGEPAEMAKLPPQTGSRSVILLMQLKSPGRQPQPQKAATAPQPVD